jgi:hypothetical protein
MERHYDLKNLDKNILKTLKNTKIPSSNEFGDYPYCFDEKIYTYEE